MEDRLIVTASPHIRDTSTTRGLMGNVVIALLPAVLAALRARGVTTLATALYRSRPLDEAGNDFPGGLCVVIGSEGQGLTDRTVEACHMAVRIPMTDRVESLNAAVAGSVLLWHFRGV